MTSDRTLPTRSYSLNFLSNFVFFLLLNLSSWRSRRGGDCGSCGLLEDKILLLYLIVSVTSYYPVQIVFHRYNLVPSRNPNHHHPLHPPHQTTLHYHHHHNLSHIHPPFHLHDREFF